MVLSRVLLLLILATFLADCAAIAPLSQAREKAPTKLAQTEPTHTVEMMSELKSRTPMPPVRNPKTATTSAVSEKDSLSATTPNVGSPEWKKEQAEDKRKEERLKQVIEGICRGC